MARYKTFPLKCGSLHGAAVGRRWYADREAYLRRLYMPVAPTVEPAPVEVEIAVLPWWARLWNWLKSLMGVVR